MKVVIIEDEIPAAEKLERYLQKFDANIELAAVLPSIDASVSWLTANQADIDLIFMDIQLSDGLSFEIFSKIALEKPVIFTTAFDEYAIDAFKVNGIDYLLKPIRFTDLSDSLKRLEILKKQLLGESHIAKLTEKLTANLNSPKNKDRFLVKLGNHIHSIKSEDIALFQADGRTVYLFSKEGKKFIIDFKMEDLAALMNPTLFYRVNRSFIVNINAIQDVMVYSNSRLRISTKLELDKEIIVSREKVSTFKSWLEGN